MGLLVALARGANLGALPSKQYHRAFRAILPGSATMVHSGILVYHALYLHLTAIAVAPGTWTARVRRRASVRCRGARTECSRRSITGDWAAGPPGAGVTKGCWFPGAGTSSAEARSGGDRLPGFFITLRDTGGLRSLTEQRPWSGVGGRCGRQARPRNSYRIALQAAAAPVPCFRHPSPLLAAPAPAPAPAAHARPAARTPPSPSLLFPAVQEVPDMPLPLCPALPGPGGHRREVVPAVRAVPPADRVFWRPPQLHTHSGGALLHCAVLCAVALACWACSSACSARHCNQPGRRMCGR